MFFSDIIRRNRDRFVGGVVSGITLFLVSEKRVQVVNKHNVINIGSLLHKAEIFNNEAKPQVAFYNIKAKLYYRCFIIFLPWETFIVVGSEVGVGKYERCVLLCFTCFNAFTCCATAY